MVRHDNKFVQKILFLSPVLQHDFNEEAGYLVNLEQASFFQDIGSNKVGGVTCCPSVRNGHAIPQRLKPAFYSTLPQA
jgi:hypothetical protein